MTFSYINIFYIRFFFPILYHWECINARRQAARQTKVFEMSTNYLHCFIVLLGAYRGSMIKLNLLLHLHLRWYCTRDLKALICMGISDDAILLCLIIWNIKFEYIYICIGTSLRPSRHWSAGCIGWYIILSYSFIMRNVWLMNIKQINTQTNK